MCHDNEEWCKIWRRHDLPIQNWDEGFDKILNRALENLKNFNFNGLLLAKVYNVWAEKGAEELCLITMKTDTKFEGKLTCAF